VAAEREMKSRILDEYCRTLHCHRQAAIRALGRTPQPRRRSGRRVQYDRGLVPTLERLWHISDRLCGKLLAAALPTLVPALERHGLRIAAEHRRQLLALSPATIDRLLQPLPHSPGPAAVSRLPGGERVEAADPGADVERMGRQPAWRGPGRSGPALW